jgi:DNA-binding MarR family transcriptional regulator
MAVSGSAGTKLAQEMGRSCLNMRARLVSRLITSIYDDELRPFGIKASQLNVLATVASMSPVRRTDVGRYMHLDVSTLTRNLRIMETNGWIEEAADSSDGRGAPIRITAAGDALIVKAAPAWRDAQRHVSRLLGPEGKVALMEMAGGLAS